MRGAEFRNDGIYGNDVNDANDKNDVNESNDENHCERNQVE